MVSLTEDSLGLSFGESGYRRGLGQLWLDPHLMALFFCTGYANFVDSRPWTVRA